MGSRIRRARPLAVGTVVAAHLLLGAGLWASATADTSAPQTLAPTSNADAGAFGVFAAFTGEFTHFANSLGLDADAYRVWAGSRLNELGATWTRSNLQLVWDLVEPTVGGGYHWEASFGGDDVFAGAARAGVHYLAVFGEGGSGPRAEPGRPALRNPLDDLPAYQRFVEAAVERYDGDGVADAPEGITIHHWQVGNEIPGWTRSGRSAADYVRWFAATAEAARRADPDARMVLTASLTGSRLDSFHAEVIPALAEQGVRFDAVDVHHWGRADLASSRMEGVPDYRAALAAAGVPDVEIWSCEHGTYVGRPSPRYQCSPSCPANMACLGDRGCVPRCTAQTACPAAGQTCDETSGLCVENYPEQSYADQARSLVYRYVANRALGVRRILWNNLAAWHCFGGGCNGYYDLLGLVVDGQGPGETRPDRDAVRPAFHSFRLLAERTDEAVAEQLGEVATGEPRAHVYGYRDRASGRRGLVAWAETPLTIELEIEGDQAEITGLVTDPDGNPLRVEALSAPAGRASVALDPDPVWIGVAEIAPPAAPNDLVATIKTSRRVALSWGDVTAESGYHVEMRRGAGDFSEIAQVAADATRLVVKGLQPGARYAFRVRARNAAGFSTYSKRVVVVMPR